MSSEVTPEDLHDACLVLIIRPGGQSLLWLDEEQVTVDQARQLLTAAAGHVPGDPDPEGVPSGP